MTEFKQILTVKEAAELLGYKDQTVYLLCSKEQLPHLKIRGKIRFEREILEKWLVDNCKRIGYTQ